MPPTLLDGKKIAEEQVYPSLQAQVDSIRASRRAIPCVAFVLVGDHGPSLTYVARKQATAARLGIVSRRIDLPAHTTQAALLDTIASLASDSSVHGILVQSPLPPHIQPLEIFGAIPAYKDVDGFSAVNVGRLAQEDPQALVACTPLGILTLLRAYHIDTVGRHIVVLGRSMIVGRPLSILMSSHIGGNATVTTCHSASIGTPQLTRTADILISAMGRPHMIQADWIQPGAVVVDVGICRIDDPASPRGYRIVGDIDYAQVATIASAITPVPGGVGPMTVAMLMSNTLKAYHLQTA